MKWTARPQPLEVEAVLAEGEAAVFLAQKLIARCGGELEGGGASPPFDQRCGGELEGGGARLSGVSFPGGLVILGPAQDLPWVDGVVYLGRPSELQPVYLPTHRLPEFPLEWLEGALRAQCPPPWAVLEDGRVIGLGEASALEIGLLERFLANAAP